MFRCIALGGGGVRGGLHVGALLELERRQGHLRFPDGIYGTSVGSILATAIAFGLRAEQIRDMFLNHMDVKSILPTLRFQTVTNAAKTKGLFPMDQFESTVLRAFDSQGIDLRKKKISDAEQQLWIVASNMTTQRATLFTGDVLVMDAIRCSSCIPVVFQPQILFNHVYLDGGVYVDNLGKIVPPHCLVLHISEPPGRLFPTQLESMSLPSYLHTLYRSFRTRKCSPNTLWLENTTIGILHELTDEDKQTLIQQGTLQTRAWLSKRAHQESV